MLRCRFYFTMLLVFYLGVLCPADSPFSVNCLWGWDGCYRPMEWTPVEIDISSSLEEPFAGTIRISTQQDGLNTLNIAHEFVLTPGLSLHVPLVTKLAFAPEECAVRLTDERGRTQWYHNYKLWDFSQPKGSLTAVTRNDLLIGVVGRRDFGMISLLKSCICQAEGGQGKVYVKQKLPRMVPWDWTGFASLDLLVLYDPQWDSLRGTQLSAVSQWVSNGGRLLIVLGSNPLVEDNPLSADLPIEIGQAQHVTISRASLRELNTGADKPETIVCWPMELKADAKLCTVHSYGCEEAIFATGYVGFGRVGILGFDPAQLSSGASEKGNKLERFWVDFFAEVLHGDVETYHPYGKIEEAERNANYTHHPNHKGRTIEFVGDEQAGSEEYEDYMSFNIGTAQKASNAVMEFLYNVAEMKPLSIWWVILLLSLLAVLLGPVDYTVLKRLDKLPMTWLTCSGWIVLFTVGAYYGVRALRAGRMQLRIVSVCDAIEGCQGAWRTNYSGIFAPRSDDYELTGLFEQQWWSAMAPTEENIWGYNNQRSSRNLYCFQHDGSNKPYSVPINIWTIQCLVNEEPAEGVDIDADVKVSGNKIFARIKNHCDEEIEFGWVRFGKNKALSIDSVAGGQEKKFSGKLSYYEPWEARKHGMQYNYGEYEGRFSHDSAYMAQGSLRRTRIIEEYLANGAAVVCVKLGQSSPPFSIKNRSYDFNHIRLARLVVFPELEIKEP